MKYTDEMIDYIRSIAPNTHIKDITDMFNAKYCTNQSVGAIGSMMQRYCIKNGLVCTFQKGNIPHNKGVPMTEETRKKVQGTWFQKGNNPLNTRDVGSELLGADGYLVVKVQETGKRCEKWRQKHILVWEQYHKMKVPKGHVVIFLDGDRTNFDITNLALITRRENMRLNQYGYRFTDAKLTETAINIVKLKNKIFDKTHKIN